LHPKQITKWLVHIREHPWVLGQATGTLDYKTHHGADSGRVTTILPIVFFVPLRRTCTRMALFPGTPKLESRNCPEIVPVGVPRLWELIPPDCKVWLWRGLNQSCSPRQDLFNDILYSQFGGREEVDSQLLMVGSQTANLTPGPSFAHKVSYRCPNGQYEAIFDIYASRPFQWHQEHLNARCFGPCCRTLNIRESRRTTSPHFFQVLGFTPTLGQCRVATQFPSMIFCLHTFFSMNFFSHTTTSSPHTHSFSSSSQEKKRYPQKLFFSKLPWPLFELVFLVQWKLWKSFPLINDLFIFHEPMKIENDLPSNGV
jgi:hypothetical protein